MHIFMSIFSKNPSFSWLVLTKKVIEIGITVFGIRDRSLTKLSSKKIFFKKNYRSVFWYLWPSVLQNYVVYKKKKLEYLKYFLIYYRLYFFITEVLFTSNINIYGIDCRKMEVIEIGISRRSQTTKDSKLSSVSITTIVSSVNHYASRT
jgi:hypothetical protein